MLLALLELLALVLIGLVVWTQVLGPAMAGLPWFPILRKSKVEALRPELEQAEDEVAARQYKLRIQRAREFAKQMAEQQQARQQGFRRTDPSRSWRPEWSEPPQQGDNTPKGGQDGV